LLSFRCVACSATTQTDRLDPVCHKCGSAVLLADEGAPEVTRQELEAEPVGVWRYFRLLPRIDQESIVSLGEGGTPLLRAQRLGEELGLSNLMIKDESRNPTGSFMDRGSTVLLSLAKERGIKECACITTGNLGASLSAYCAKAGIHARVRIHPSTDREKLYQMLAYGADVEPSTSAAPQRARSLSVTAGNPFLIEGEKTTGFEVVQDLGWKLPDVIVVPVGTGGHLSTIWRSVSLLKRLGVAEGDCRLLGVQVRGDQPAIAGRRAREAPAVVILPELEESVPYFSREADRAIGESGGVKLLTSAAKTIDSTRLLATTEGIFAEPSSASVVSAVAEAVRRGDIQRSETVVCVITGAGLKDTKTISRLARETRRAAGGDPYALPTSKIGHTKLELLRFLRQGPCYGYELWLRAGSRRKISTASIYQHLSELEGLAMARKKGTVHAKGRERVMYELTKRGADFLKATDRLELPGER
jgi:threonine synthase